MLRSAMDERSSIAGGVDWQSPRKISLTIAGHSTSIRIESVYWAYVESAAAEWQVPLSSVVAEIDAARMGHPDPPNLASAIRLWALHREKSRKSL